MGAFDWACGLIGLVQIGLPGLGFGFETFGQRLKIKWAGEMGLGPNIIKTKTKIDVTIKIEIQNQN